MHNLQAFLLGLFISLSGQLPFSSMNFTALQINLTEGLKNALLFALGIAIVEVCYVRISLFGIGWIMQHKTWIIAMEWVTIVLFMVLSISSFRTAYRNSPNQKTLLLKNNWNRFLLGAMISSINPLQIPFWFIWSSYLFSNNLLHQRSYELIIYVLGIGCGTVAGISAYIFGGKWLVQKFNASQRTINYILAVFFLFTALFQLYKVCFKPVI